MKLFKSLELLVRSEARARRYLSEKSWQNKTRFCIRCRSTKIYRLADKRYRCARCGYTFQEFAGRWIAELNLSAAKWLWTLKLFELELTANRIADEIGISYPTVLKAMRLIRCALVQQYLRAKPTAAEAFWHGVLMDSLGRERGAGAKEATVFSARARDGSIEIAPVRSISAVALRKNNIALTRLGSVFYVTPWDRSHALLFWGGGRFNANRLTAAPVRSAPASAVVENFLLFAKDCLGRHARISQRHFPLYLMETKFRFDHRGGDIFDLLARAIAQLVPTR